MDEITGKQTKWKIGDIAEAALKVISEAKWDNAAAELKAKTDTKAEIEKATGVKWDTIRQCLWVSKAFPIGNRESGLSWSHYRELSFVADKAIRIQKLNEAVEEGWTVIQLANELRPDRTVRTCTQCKCTLPDAGKYRMQVDESKTIIRLCSMKCLNEWICTENIRNRQQTVEE